MQSRQPWPSTGPNGICRIRPLEANDGRDSEEYRFWFGLFLKLAKRERVGWA